MAETSAAWDDGAGTAGDLLPDPAQLPIRWQSPASGGAALSIVIDRRQATVRRHVAGTPMTLVIPITAFRAVVARVDDGDDTVAIELRHADPGLTIPLGRTGDVARAAGLSRRWAEVLELPLLVAEADGTLTALAGEPAAPRVAPRPAGLRPAEAESAILRAITVHRGGRTTVMPQ